MPDHVETQTAAELDTSDLDVVELDIPTAGDGLRLDKALARAADAIPGLSRSRLAQLIDAGAVTDSVGRTVTDTRRKVKVGETFTLRLPPALPAEPAAEAIPLAIVFEDADLIVIDKPAGMVVHPAPGAATGTLVNALLHHCGDSLVGIGGVARPGIVHRIDKDTSGLLVAAKSQAAHTGLAALFATHDIERSYRALAWGAPDRAEPRLASRPGAAFEGGWLKIATQIARHPTERKRMAVSERDGRHAVTRMRMLERFGAADAPFASLLECRLETGRTHQIRVHASHIGHPLIGDPVYGHRRALSAKTVPQATHDALAAFPRQALHAATLGFCHPITGKTHRFDAPYPQDFCTLLAGLRRIGAAHS